MAKTVRAPGPGAPLPADPLRIFPGRAHYPLRILPIDRTGYSLRIPRAGQHRGGRRDANRGLSEPQRRGR